MSSNVENNSSKRWDGKVLSLEGEWLESLYQPNKLVIGSKLKLPWSGKGGKITYWNAVGVDPNSTTKAQGMVNGSTHAVLAYYTNLGKGKASSGVTEEVKATKEKRNNR